MNMVKKVMNSWYYEHDEKDNEHMVHEHSEKGKKCMILEHYEKGYELVVS